jgi:Arc/MetJ-type ribon-helix-helix transcriptional regulator
LLTSNWIEFSNRSILEIRQSFAPAEEHVVINSIDFFSDRRYLDALLEREGYRCFYSLREVTKDTCVLDHVVPLVNGGNNFYRNIGAVSHDVNALKQGQNAEEFRRFLFRKGMLSPTEVEERMESLRLLKDGKLVPGCNRSSQPTAWDGSSDPLASLAGLVRSASALGFIDPLLDSGCGMNYRHTVRWVMARSKVAISLDESTLNRLDRLVKKRVFPNRSQAIEEAVAEKLARLEKSRLAHECAKLDPIFEKALAEEGLSQDLKEWPEYWGARSAGPTWIRCEGENKRDNVQFWFWARMFSMSVPEPLLLLLSQVSLNAPAFH